MQTSVSDLTGKGGLRRIIFGGLALVALWLNPGAAQAQTNSVVSSNSATALNAALQGGGTVVLTFDGTMTVTNPFTINEDNVVLEGNGRTISGGGTSRIFIVPAGITSFTVRNLNIVNGKHTGANGGPGLKGNDGGSNGSSGGAGGPGGPGGTGRGGAILNQGTLILQNCNLLTNNATAGNGGAGGAGGNSIFQGGNGGAGGAGGAAFGGAIFNDLNANLLLTNCNVLGNLAIGGNGGAGGTNGTGGTSLMGSGGAAGNAAGAGVYNNHGSVVVVNCALALNQGTGGNGAAGGTTSQGNTGLTGTKGGDGLGGAICNVGNLSVTNSTFFQNTLAGGGGGNGGSALFTGGNGANGGGAYGGAIYNNGASTNVLFLASSTLANSVISGGTNGVGGGGSTTGKAGSFGPSGGANIANAAGDFEMVNTILSNVAGLTNSFGTIADLGGNISSDFTPKFNFSTLPNNKNLKLGSFTDNGGPTLTMALNLGSSAIDNGLPDAALPFDQRGYSRPAGNQVDVGAFEFGNQYSILGRVFIGTNAGSNVTVTATINDSGVIAGTTTTDANGNYSLTHLPANDYLLNATLPSQPADYFQPTSFFVHVGPSTNSINFVANNIFSISGTVTGGSNITVSAVGPMSSSAITGTNGSYSITNLQAGSYTVAVTGQPSGLYQPTNYTVNVGPASTNNVNFAATGTNAINGRVMIGINGASNITVTANSFSTTTDRSGNYSFSNLVANSYTVAAQPSGSFQPASYSIALARVTNSINFALTNAATMRVSNAPDATISVSVPAIPNQTYRIQSTTNISNPTNWVTLSTTNSGTNGLFNLILPTTDFTNQFFRAVTP